MGWFTWLQGRALSHARQSLCCPMVWSVRYGLKAGLLAPEVKLIISALYRCHTSSFAEVHTWVICSIHCNLCTDPRSLQVHWLSWCHSLYWGVRELLDSLNIMCRPWWTMSFALDSSIESPSSCMLHYSPCIILNIPPSWQQSSWRSQPLTGILWEANHYL